MGYESSLEEDFKIKKEFIEKVRKKINDFNEKNNEKRGDNFWLDFRTLFFESLTIDDEGYLDRNEHYGKWGSLDRDYAFFLKDFVGAGKMIFAGEDGEKWGFFFDGKGNVFEISFIEKISVEAMK